MTPPYSTGSNGLPVATSARPSVHRIRSAGTASAFDVGLDSGMMIGRSTVDAICCTMRSAKAPDWVEVPISIVGFAFTTTSASAIRPPYRDQVATWAAGRAYGCWKSRNAAESSVRSPRLSTAQNLPLASCSESPSRIMTLRIMSATPMPAVPGTMDDRRLVMHPAAGGLHRGECGGQNHGRGALHVVIERAHLGGVLGQDAPGVAGAEVLPMQHR